MLRLYLRPWLPPPFFPPLCRARLVSLNPRLPHAIRTHSSQVSATKPFYITTPIFYVNADPHIGHLHSLVLADVLKRFHALRDGDARGAPVMLTGTDEHGMKIQRAAEARNMSPIQLCDTVSTRFSELANAAGVDYDIFFRTTAAGHKLAVQRIWRELVKKDLIYKATYAGWYSVSDETYLTEKQVEDRPDANGMVRKCSVDSGHPVEWMEEENYMFKLSSFQQQLKDRLKNSPTCIVPEVRYNEIMSSLEAGPLGDLSISRPQARLQWGIPVPDDPNHTIYVWFDALANYLSATGYPKPQQLSIWPADVHLVGKDILRFHSIYWPAMLMALDLPLPGTILAHSHWTMNNVKMSKSLGNVVNPFEALKTFSSDGIRLYLTLRGRLDSDSDYTPEGVKRDYRKYLAGQCGNLVTRLRSKAILRKFETALAYEGDIGLDTSLSELDHKLERLTDDFDKAMARFDISGALELVLEFFGDMNQLLAAKEPWKMTDGHALASFLPLLVDGIIRSTILLQPYIPISADKLLTALGVPSTERTWRCACESHQRIRCAAFLKHANDSGRLAVPVPPLSET